MHNDKRHITVNDLTMAYGHFLIQQDLNFTIEQGDIFVIMGDSGCGKSTLLRHLIGLLEPAQGEIWYGDTNFSALGHDEKRRYCQHFGILYQSGALWSSMTIAENIAIPLEEYTSLSKVEIREIISLKLALVGLAGFEDFYPYEISGGMRKRVGLARAIALDPKILFFDEPSAGLDPLSADQLDDLILELKESYGATVVMVTHELASIFKVATNSIFLDSEQKTMLATGHPKTLLENSDNRKIVNFLSRGKLEPNMGIE